MSAPLLFSLLVLGLVTSFGADKAPVAEPAGAAVKLRFAPEGGPWRGESAFEGAAWTKLGKGFIPGVLMMHARAGIGDKFPVQEVEKVTLFDVVLTDGNDDHLLLEVRSKAGVEKIDVARDNKVAVEVAGVKYEFCFPTQSVNATPNELPSTNKATIIVTRKEK